MALRLGFTRWDLLTGWTPLAVVLLGLLLVGALLIHPERLGPIALVLVGACTSIQLLALWVLLIGWL